MTRILEGMEKATYKLVGSTCAQHGQYTFHKAFRYSNGKKEKIIALGDFFFVKIWPDSELISVGEMQLLWTDRVSDQTLCSLRLYFLPDNTPDGRGNHGEDEVVAINEKVVIKMEDLLTWICDGSAWRWGITAVYRGDCVPPSEVSATTSEDSSLTATKLDFADVDTEKNLVEDLGEFGVAVFSYPRYCRYRAVQRRLEGVQSKWLRDSLVGALGGYAAPTRNTRIMFCRDTFEYPELEGNEMVCNHLAPRLKGRPRGRRRRRTAPDEPQSDSDSSLTTPTKQQVALTPSKSCRKSSDEEGGTTVVANNNSSSEKAFISQLRTFHKQHSPGFNVSTLKRDMNLSSLYREVKACGGYEAACKQRAWNNFNQLPSAKKAYEKYLLPFERYEKRNTSKPPKSTTKTKNGETTHKTENPVLIDTIEISDSPVKENPHKYEEKVIPKLRTPSPEKKQAVELNQEFLDSLPKTESPKLEKESKAPIKISVKPVEKLMNTTILKDAIEKVETNSNPLFKESILAQMVANPALKESLLAQIKSDESLFSQLANGEVRVTSHDGLTPKGILCGTLTNGVTNGNALSVTNNGIDIQKSNSPPSVARPAGVKSSLRSVRVKPTRNRSSPTSSSSWSGVQPDSASSSPPTAPPSNIPPATNFGINYPPRTAQVSSTTSQPENNASDDEIVEVPYKPKTPEIIDLDEYESPESPQSAKRKKLEILKERGLEVTALPAEFPTPAVAVPIIPTAPILGLNPVVQQQIMNQAQFFHMYSMLPPPTLNGVEPPKVLQTQSIYGSTGPEKTVYGNPKDIFMPPPHIIAGTAVKPKLNKCVSVTATTPPVTDLLDLTCKTSSKPAVEIVRVPSVPQNLAKSSYSLVDGKAVVGSNLEITLVNSKGTTTPPRASRPPQKRSSTGKFMSNKTPPKDLFSSPPTPVTSKPETKRPPSLIIPNYSVSREPESAQSSSSTSHSEPNPLVNLLQNPFLQKNPNLAPLMDPMYMNAFYSSLAGQFNPGLPEQQLAFYREFSSRFLRNYPGIGTPTTKN